MRLAALYAIILLSFTAPSFAQNTGATTWDVSGGVSYAHITDATPDNLYGWHLSVAERPYPSHPWVGGDIEANGGYSNSTTTILSTGVKTSYGLYTFMAGPVLEAPSGHARPFVHALMGGALQRGAASALGQTATATTTNFCFGGGGGFDFSLSRRLAVRTQADFIRVNQANASAIDLVQASAGLVVRF